jgi:MFS transporter, CP family, cyanate transporter
MKQRYFPLVLALFLASLNLRPAITSVSPLLETLRSELGMSGSMASLLTSIPVLCMGIFSPLAVKLGFRWGIERILWLALMLIGAATVLRLFTASELYLLATSLLAGIGIAATGPLLSGFIKRNFPNQVPAMIGVYSVAMVIGAALSAGLTVPLQGAMSGSWRLALASWAVLVVIALPVWWLAVLRKAEKPASQGTASNAGRLPLGRPKAWLLTLFFGLMAMLFYSLTAWLAPVVLSMGYSKVYSGGVLTVFTLVQIPSTLIIPLLINRFPSRLPWLIGCALFELVGLVLLSAFGVSPILCAVLLGIGAGGLFPLALMLPIDETSNPQDASTWSAMAQSGGYVIGAVGPMLVGWIRDATQSYANALTVLIAICLIMIVVQLIIGLTTGKNEKLRQAG